MQCLPDGAVLKDDRGGVLIVSGSCAWFLVAGLTYVWSRWEVRILGQLRHGGPYIDPVAMGDAGCRDELRLLEGLTAGDEAQIETYRGEQ